MNRQPSDVTSLADRIKEKLIEYLAIAAFWGVILFFAFRLWRSVQADPREYERLLGHGMVWFAVQCGFLYLFLFLIWGLIAGCLMPCVGYSQKTDAMALVTLCSSVILLFVVGLAPKAVDGTALVGYLVVLNLVAHGIAAVMQAIGLSIRATDEPGGWLGNSWMTIKRCVYFGITGFSLMTLTIWWSGGRSDSRSDAELLAAAERGHAASQDSWACRLDRRGQRPAAIVWLNKAVEQGNRSAMCNLAVMIRQTDPAWAFALAVKAAVPGYPRGLYTLGRYHRDGVGTPVNKLRAAELFREAAFSTGGYPPAMNDLMVLIHGELPDKFRSSLFEKLRDQGLNELKQAKANWQPTNKEAAEALEALDDAKSSPTSPD